MFRVVRPSPAVILSATLVVGTATFIAVPLLAQTFLAQNETPKPAEAGKSEPGKSEPAKTDPGKPEPAKGEPAKDAIGHPDESVESVRILMGPAGHGECIWLGKRVVGLMWKDDLDTAFRHLELYDRFGCPGEHLQLSFRCVVRQGDLQKDPQVGKDPKVFDNRVDDCWKNPATPAAPVNPPTAAVEKPGTK
jgi:hypothetical protein